MRIDRKEFDVIMGMGEASWEGEQMKTKYDMCKNVMMDKSDLALVSGKIFRDT